VPLDKRPTIIASLSALLVALTACANSPTSKVLEQSFSPDSSLKDNPITFGQSSQNNTQNQTLAKLPADFPTEIPLYPEAQLQEVKQPTTSDNQDQVTVWTTAAPSNLVQSFYQKAFESNSWQIVSQPAFDDANSPLVARRNNLQVTVSVQPLTSLGVQTPSSSQTTGSRNAGDITKFLIQYSQDAEKAAVPQPGEPDFIGPVLPSEVANTSADTLDAKDSTQMKPAGSSVFTDINKAPADLRKYVEDLAALGVLMPDKSASKSNSAAGVAFEPNKNINRRQYVRWLVAANNQIYTNSPSKQIRLAAAEAQPAFQDVPRTDPDFPAIQGLAEAGLIPSPLSGDSTTVLFRPDAPLTRENLILWKVPLDTRQALPAASVDAVKQTWGFQDAARIDPKALRAVLADFQNGEQANIRRVFGYTALFQPKKTVTRAEATAAIWYFGTQGEGLSAKEALQLKGQQTQPSATPEPAQS
jgi:hypothetical protein